MQMLPWQLCPKCKSVASVCLQKRAFDAFVKQKTETHVSVFLRGERGIIFIDPITGSPANKNQPLGGLCFFVFRLLTKARFRRRRKTKKPKLSFRFFLRKKRDYFH